MGGLHSVHQQFQFRQLKQPGTDEVAVLRAFDADDVQAEVHEQLDIAVHIFPGGLDAMSLPKTENIPRQLRSGAHLSASGEVVAIGEFGSADRFAYWSSSISKTLLV